jgi:LmbE family N-acetylglucosaminyl deacetylase
MKDLVRRFLARGWALVLRVRSTPHVLHEGTTLVISPHADDETLGCGGLIAARAARGLPTEVVFLTDSGGTSGNQTARREQARVRHSEALEALSILGVGPASVHFLDATDGQLDKLDHASSEALRSGLGDLVRALNPSEIYLPFLGSHSTEHEAAHGICREVFEEMWWRGRLWEYPVWAWWNPPRFASRCKGKPRPTVLTLGENLAKKRAALLAHASQHAPGGALPGILARICLGKDEFFFPVTGARSLPTEP